MFLMQGTGLSEIQQAVCDRFVYIPQYGPGTASLNVTVAASIVLHRFAVWAGFCERNRCGAKFVVGEKPQRTTRRGRGLLAHLDAAFASPCGDNMQGESGD